MESTFTIFQRLLRSFSLSRLSNLPMKDRSFLPFDIIINILQRLPVKTLTRFKCVAKDWLKLIESPNFIAQHLSHSASNNTFLLQQTRVPLYLLIGPDLEVHSPQFMDFPADFHILGSCNGLLLCVNDYDRDDLFLCNPATGQIKQVPETVVGIHIVYHIGFGFSHIVNDYKIVRTSSAVQFDRVEVYSLTTGSWKEINIVHLHHLCPPRSRSVTANGAIFWKVSLISEVAFDPHHDLILSFDIAQEVFTVFEGPPQSQPPPTLGSAGDILAVHNDKLAVFRLFHVVREGIFQSCSFDMWVLEDTCTVRENWVKKYSVGPFTRLFFPICFWRDGIVCSENHIDQGRGLGTSLSLINPYSYEMKSIPDHRFHSALFNYVESLVAVGNIDEDP